LFALVRLPAGPRLGQAARPCRCQLPLWRGSPGFGVSCTPASPAAPTPCSSCVRAAVCPGGPVPAAPEPGADLSARLGQRLCRPGPRRQCRGPVFPTRQALFSRATLGCCGPNSRPSVSTLPGRWRRSAAVTRVRAGHEVYANLLEHGYGGFAEYVSVPVEVLSLKPANLSFEEAAAVPMAGSPPCSRVWTAAAPQALVPGQLRAASRARQSPA